MLLRHIRPVAWILSILVLSSTGCSSGADPEPVATLPPDSQAVLAAAATAMGEVKTVEFSIERTGAPLYIDPLDLLTFNKAEGRFAAPTSADAVVTVEVGGFNTKIGAIAFEGKTWLSDPITGKYAPAPSGYAFDPATLFDADVGWRPLLASGLSDVEWLGLEATAQGDRYRLRAVADPERVEVITAGLVKDQTVVLDIRLDTATGAVREVEFSTVNEGETSTWKLGFSRYGEAITVSPPPDDSG